MLGIIFEKTTAMIKETYNAVEATVEYVIDDVASIPDAVSKGWSEGVFNKETPVEPTQSPKDPETQL